MSLLNRRGFLVLTGLLSPARSLAAQTPRAASDSTVSLDEFLVLAQRLVGRTKLDAQVAATYFNALVSVPANIPLLAGLARNTGSGSTPAHLALERTIIEWWYTGAYTVGGERRLATHTGALMWNVLGGPPGTCVGGFGAWARPPQGRA